MWLACLMFSLLTAVAAPPADDPNVIVRDYTVDAVLQAGACKITIHPRAPWSLKPTTPLEAVFESEGALTFSKQTLTEKDYVDPKAADKTLMVQITSPAPVTTSVKAALNFFLCTDQVCQRYRETAQCKFATTALYADGVH